MFAYFESSMVVEYIIDQFGFEALLAILRDLGDGVLINDALERNTATLEELDMAFVEFIRERAENLAPDVDWSAPEVVGLFDSPIAGVAVAAWLEANPNNLAGLIACGRHYMELEEWESALSVLQRAHDLYPSQTGGDSPALLLADLYRATGDGELERAVLVEYAAVDPDAVSTYLRLIEIDRLREDWEAVREQALRAVAVNPLIPQPHRALADSAERLAQPAEAIAACEALLALAPDDPAGLHYRLALLYDETGDAATARRHVLLALEEAPRFREAHALLLTLVRDDGTKSN
jgi:tetratricopeptide (TPR) repeat protein